MDEIDITGGMPEEEFKVETIEDNLQVIQRDST